MAEAQARAKKQSGTETRQRQRRLVIRLAPGEWAQVVSAADAAGLTLASYGRARMLAQATTRAVRRAPVDAEVLARVLAQLGRVGGNLHQLVRHLNFGEYDALADVAEVVTELRSVAAEIMGALGRPPRANGD
jgi:hypothetical protein